MTSWFEQGQGESWESGESFESPFAEGGEAWSEVTEAPAPRVVGRRVLGGAVGAAFVRAVGRRVRRAVGRDVVAHVHLRPTSRGRRHPKSRHQSLGCPRPHRSRRRARGATRRPAGRAEADGHRRWSPSHGPRHGQVRSRMSRSRPSRSSAPLSRSRRTSRSSRSRRRWKVRRRGLRVTPSSTGRSGCAPASQGNRVMPLIDGPTTFDRDAGSDRDCDRPTPTSSTCSHGGATRGSTSPVQARRCSTCSTPRARRACRSACSSGMRPRPSPGSRTTRACTTRPKRRSTASRTAIAQQDDAGLTREPPSEAARRQGKRGPHLVLWRHRRQRGSPLPAAAARRVVPQRPSPEHLLGRSKWHRAARWHRPAVPCTTFTRSVTGRAASWLLQSFLLALVGSLGRPRHRPPRSAARPVGRIDLRSRAPQFARVGRTFSGVVQRPGSRVARAGTRGASPGHLAARDPRRPSRFIYIEEQYLTNLCGAEAIRSVLPKVQHVTILIPPSEITDLNGVWRRRREFIDRITRGNPHANKLHVYTLADKGCVRDGPHTYVHSKMAVIDDDLLLIGSANCNHRGWETDSELVVAAFEHVGLDRFSTAHKLRMALWREHLGEPESILRDPIMSRGFWDSSPHGACVPTTPAAALTVEGSTPTASSTRQTVAATIRAVSCSASAPDTRTVRARAGGEARRRQAARRSR